MAVVWGPEVQGVYYKTRPDGDALGITLMCSILKRNRGACRSWQAYSRVSCTLFKGEARDPSSCQICMRA